MVPCTQEGGRGGTIHCAIWFVGEIQGGEGVNQEYTNEYLVKAKEKCRRQVGS